MQASVKARNAKKLESCEINLSLPMKKATCSLMVFASRIGRLGSTSAMAARSSPAALAGSPAVLSWASPGFAKLVGMSIRWLTIFLDFPGGSSDAGVAFWREVTGTELSPSRGMAGEFATLLPPDGDSYLRVQRVGEGAGGCHLDVHADLREGSLDDAAARATTLGARVLHRDDISSGSRLVQGFPGWLAMADPTGRPYCLTSRDPGLRGLPGLPHVSAQMGAVPA